MSKFVILGGWQPNQTIVDAGDDYEKAEQMADTLRFRFPQEPVAVFEVLDIEQVLERTGAVTH